MDKKEVDVIVVGAGISGLTAARTLYARDPNMKLLVLEGKGKFLITCFQSWATFGVLPIMVPLVIIGNHND